MRRTFSVFSRPLAQTGAAVVAASALVLSGLALAPAVAEVTVELEPPTAKRTYIVQLDTPSVPARAEATPKGSAPSVTSWRSTLKAEQSAVRAAMADELGIAVKAERSWTEAINGFTTTLTGDQAHEVAALPGVRSVTVDRLLDPQSTSNGTDWIKADSLWTGTVSAGIAAKGEGIVIGIIDSGVNPQNPSFAASVPVSAGGDGHVVTNPRGSGDYLGMCDPESTQHVENWGCTDKLIGAWQFVEGVDASDRYDDLGHGTHTASTAAGNQVRATWPGTDILPVNSGRVEPDSGLATTISGVAPHANLISYDVCTGRCPTSSSIAAYNQAILDGVDVINFSIGGDISSVSNAWADPLAQAQLSARKAGISVAVSAGNNGSSDKSISSYGDVPWVTSVANTSHDLSMTNGSITFTTAAGGATSLGTLSTATISGSTAGTFPLVWAKDIDNVATGHPYDGTCQPGDLSAGAAAGTIVICKRSLGSTTGMNGTFTNAARVSKGRAVKDAGGAGMILLNGSATQDLPHDVHVLPAAHLTSAQAATLTNFLTANPTTKASISGGSFTADASVADVVNASSSRGPTRNGTNGIGPSLAAPGTDVLAAGGKRGESAFEVMSGTSMASPHVAGAMALLKQVHPTWTDAEIASALMTTATTAIKDYNGTAATWFEMGSGRIDLSRATRAGLLIDTPTNAYDGKNPSGFEDLRTVNSAQITNGACLSSCTTTRTVTSTEAGLGTWTAAVTSGDPQLALSVDRSTFEVTTAVQDVAVAVTATITAPVADAWYSGTLTLTPPAGSNAPAAHLPIIVGAMAAAATLGDLTTARSDGTRALGTMVASAAADEVSFTVADPITAEQADYTVAPDPTPADPYNTDERHTRAITVPSGTTALIVSLDSSSALDVDLFVGTGTVAKGGVKCSSAAPGNAERCVIRNPVGGAWWMLTQNYTGSGAGVDTVHAAVALVSTTTPSDSMKVAAVAPLAAPGLRQRLALTWDEPLTAVGEVGFAPITMTVPGLDPVTTYVRVEQVASDVAIAALPSQAQPGQMLSPSITVQPDRTGDAPIHEISVDLPAAWAPSAISAGGTAATANGVTTVTWRGTHAALAAASTLAATDPVPLTFAVSVPASAGEGEQFSVVTREAVILPGGGSSSSRTDVITVVGGSYATTTTLAATPASIGEGSEIALTATVAGSAQAAPTGTVTFEANDTPIGTSTLVDGQATYDWRSMPAGTHSLRARYQGDGANRASTSAPVSVTVKARATISLSLPASATTADKPTATVTVASTLTSQPTGTVRFLLNGRVVGTRALSGARATYVLGSLATGKHTLTAEYDGDARHLSSRTGSPRSLTVTAAPVVRAAVRITAKPLAAVRTGKKAKPLMVRVSAVGATPRGRITVTVKGAGRTVAKKVTVPTSGVVKVALPTYRKKGKVRVRVVYAGDARTLPRTLATTFTVKKR